MSNRITVALSVLVDVKVDEGADVRDVIDRLQCQCSDGTGEAAVVGSDIVDRKLVVDTGEETDVE